MKNIEQSKRFYTSYFTFDEVLKTVNLESHELDNISLIDDSGWNIDSFFEIIGFRGGFSSDERIGLFIKGDEWYELEYRRGHISIYGITNIFEYSNYNYEIKTFRELKSHYLKNLPQGS